MNTQVVVPAIASPTWEREAVATAVAEKLKEYVGVVYTADTVKAAKADRAELNKLANTLEDERKRVKNLYLAPYEQFEADVKKIVADIKKASDAIDAQVKTFEEQEKERKRKEIVDLFGTMEFHGVQFERVFNPSWLNATTSMAAIEKSLREVQANIESDFKVLETIEEYQFEAIEEYKRTVSLSMAMQEVQKRKDEEKRKAEYEAKLRGEFKREEKPAEPIEVPEVKYDEFGLPDLEGVADERHAVVVHAKVTNADEARLVAFLQEQGIEFYITGGSV